MTKQNKTKQKIHKIIPSIRKIRVGCVPFVATEQNQNYSFVIFAVFALFPGNVCRITDELMQSTASTAQQSTHSKPPQAKHGKHKCVCDIYRYIYMSNIICVHVICVYMIGYKIHTCVHNTRHNTYKAPVRAPPPKALALPASEASTQLYNGLYSNSNSDSNSNSNNTSNNKSSPFVATASICILFVYLCRRFGPEVLCGVGTASKAQQAKHSKQSTASKAQQSTHSKPPQAKHGKHKCV